MNIILIGDSGHAKVITDCVHSIKDFQIVAKLDDKYINKQFSDGCINGPLSILKELVTRYTAKIVIAIGDNEVRKKVISKYNLIDIDFVSIAHGSAVISERASVGVGTVIMPGVVVNAEARIGKHVILNTNSVIEHDCVIGDYSHISPGSILTGGVVIGEGAHIGAGSTIIPLKTVGDWSIIGAGSVVISDIEERVTAIGSPCKIYDERRVFK